jgi:ketosteroid isomerase-like protein
MNNICDTEFARPGRSHTKEQKMKSARMIYFIAALIAAPWLPCNAANVDSDKGTTQDVLPLIRVLDHIWLNSALNHDPIPQIWLFAEDFVEVHSGGEVVDGLTQAAQIGNFSSPVTEIHLDEIIGHYVSPDTVITTDTTTIGRTMGGKTDQTKYHVLRVYAKQIGRWRAVAAGLTKIGFESEHVVTTSEEHAGKDIHGPVADQLKELDRKWLHAASVRDTNYMASLFVDDFVEVHPGGEIVNKQQQIDQLKSPDLMIKDLRPDDIHVRCLSLDLALVTDTTTIEASSRGQSLSGTFRVMRVFVKHNGVWMAAGASLTPVAKNEGSGFNRANCWVIGKG